jgi:hypothetical protein
MNIYSVKFWFNVNFDSEGNIVEELDEEEMVGEENDDIESRIADGKFEIGAGNLAQALLNSIEYLDKNIGKDNYNISSVSVCEDINIINWPGENEECQCVYCRTERAADEDKLIFSCNKCGCEIKIIDGGWDEISCPHCNEEIHRDRIIGSNGNYLIINIGDKGGK